MNPNEERAAHVLRTLLLTLDTPPPRVDVADVVRNGRRWARRRRIGTAVAAMVAVGTVGASAAIAFGGSGGGPGLPPDSVVTAASGSPAAVPVANCRVQDLPRPDGMITTIIKVDDTGRYAVGVGSVYVPTYSEKLVLWRDGILAGIVDAAGGHPIAINPDGVVVGYTLGTPGAPSYGWVVRDGVVQRLAIPSGQAAALPLAINERGDILGVAALAPMGGPGAGPVVVWPAGAWDKPSVRATGQTVTPIAIRADGTFVGYLFAGDRDLGAHVWTPDGQRRPLAAPAGWNYSKVRGLRGDMAYGSVASIEPLPPGTIGQRPARWNLRTGKVEVLQGHAGQAMAATETGWLLVVNVQPPGPRGEHQAPLLIDPKGDARRLPAPAGTGVGAEAVWISDDGRTIMGEVGIDDRYRWNVNAHRPVIWRCP